VPRNPLPLRGGRKSEIGREMHLWLWGNGRPCRRHHRTPLWPSATAHHAKLI